MEWYIVQSETPNHPEMGHPMGEILCRSKKEAEEEARSKTECGFIGVYIKPYKE